MKNSYPFISMFKAEHFKTKRNIAVLSFLLFPFIATMSICAYIAIKASALIVFETNPWTDLLGNSLLIMYLFYPFLVTILVYSLCDMEYKNGNFKRLFTLPYPMHTLFASKILFLFEIIFISTLIAYASFLLSGSILNHFFPALSFHDYDIRLSCFIAHTRLFISLLAVSFIQYWLSLIFKNFVIPIGFGGFMTLFSLFTMNKEHSYLNPFVSVIHSMDEFVTYQSISFSKHEYLCLAYIIVFLFINFFTFKLQKNR